MSCALLENAKSQYKVLRYKSQISTNCNTSATLINISENSNMRMALKRPAITKSTSTEMQKRFLSESQVRQQEQTPLQILPSVETIKASLSHNQHGGESVPQEQRQYQAIQQQVTELSSMQQLPTQKQFPLPRRQIFWNTAHISTSSRFVLDVQANQAFGFATDGNERLANKHPELIRYLPDMQDRDWLITKLIIPHQKRNFRFLFLLYDEVCRLYQTHDAYRNKASINLSAMTPFTVPEFVIQKMKRFFVDLNIKSRGLITNSHSISGTTLQQQSNSHLRNALLLGTSNSATNTITTSSIATTISSSSLVGSSSSSSNITSTETLVQQKSKSSNLSSSHATLTALLNNSSSSATNSPLQ